MNPLNQNEILDHCFDIQKSIFSKIKSFIFKIFKFFCKAQSKLKQETEKNSMKNKEEDDDSSFVSSKDEQVTNGESSFLRDCPSTSSSSSSKRKQDIDTTCFVENSILSNINSNKRQKFTKETDQLNMEEYETSKKLNNILSYYEISPNTKFVLGKNVNELFARSQNLQNKQTTDPNDDNNNSKSIYTRFPNLFKYEADQSDKQWLNEKSIIQRKNVKCFLFLFDEVEELFTNLMFFTSPYFESNINNEELDNKRTQNDKKTNEIKLILDKLKPFVLPSSILNKLKKQYDQKR